MPFRPRLPDIDAELARDPKAYELFIHPDRAVDLWNALLAAGESLGVKPCGLAARDSTRTEAGLPLYGHEMAGALGLNPADAGFGSFVKPYKPFFIGRDAFVGHEATRDRGLVRFRMNEKGVRRPESGDPVLDRRGKVVGQHLANDRRAAVGLDCLAVGGDAVGRGAGDDDGQVGRQGRLARRDYAVQRGQVDTRLDQRLAHSPVSYTHLDVYKRQHRYRGRAHRLRDGL